MKEYMDTITTDISSEKVYESYYTLYFMCQNPLKGYNLKDFEYYMESPKRRMEFISLLNEAFTSDNMPKDLEDAYIELYPILISQAFGKYNKYVYVPDEISARIKNDSHNPSNEELDKLITLVKYVCSVYVKNIKNNEYTIELPEWSIDKGLELNFQIKDSNLPSLFGFTSTSSGITEWVKQELEKEYPDKVNETGEFEKGFVAKNYIPYIIKRIDHLKLLNTRVNDFVNQYRIEYPQIFDRQGDIRPEYIDSFNRVFREKFGLIYPIIEYNKIMAKTITFFNLIKFSCSPEIIVETNKTKDNIKSYGYLGVYRDYDIFGFDENAIKVEESRKSNQNTKSIMMDNFSNKFLSAFKIDNKKVLDKDTLNKITLIGLKNKREEDSTIYVSPESNLTMNLKRLLYKYRFAGRSYYLDKIVDQNNSHVYLGDLESETDYYAARFNERKEIKNAKKQAMHTIEKYINYLKSRKMQIEVRPEFRELIQEKKPSLIDSLNRIDINDDNIKSIRIR